MLRPFLLASSSALPYFPVPPVPSSFPSRACLRFPRSQKGVFKSFLRRSCCVLRPQEELMLTNGSEGSPRRLHASLSASRARDAVAFSSTLSAPYLRGLLACRGEGRGYRQKTPRVWLMVRVACARVKASDLRGELCRKPRQSRGARISGGVRHCSY